MRTLRAFGAICCSAHFGSFCCLFETASVFVFTSKHSLILIYGFLKWGWNCLPFLFLSNDLCPSYFGSVWGSSLKFNRDCVLFCDKDLNEFNLYRRGCIGLSVYSWEQERQRVGSGPVPRAFSCFRGKTGPSWCVPTVCWLHLLHENSRAILHCI